MSSNSILSKNEIRVGLSIFLATVLELIFYRTPNILWNNIESNSIFFDVASIFYSYLILSFFYIILFIIFSFLLNIKDAQQKNISSNFFSLLSFIKGILTVFLATVFIFLWNKVSVISDNYAFGILFFVFMLIEIVSLPIFFLVAWKLVNLSFKSHKIKKI